MQLSEKEMQQNKKLEKSRQEVIAGKILRIRAEIQFLDKQLKQNSAIVQQQAGEASKASDVESLTKLNTQLQNVFKMKGF